MNQVVAEDNNETRFLKSRPELERYLLYHILRIAGNGHLQNMNLNKCGALD